MKLHTALTIAGTDPSGGAGIMADLKSFQSRHVYGMAVVTSVVAQNTTGVHHVEHLSLESIEKHLHELGPRVVIIKGGHIGDDATDYAFTKDGDVRTWTSPKYDTVHTHGTGCTFSAVITAELAKGRDVMDAIGIAKDYIALAIKHNPALGHGCGPVNHMAYGLLVNGPQTMDELLKND